MTSKTEAQDPERWSHVPPTSNPVGAPILTNEDPIVSLGDRHPNLVVLDRPNYWRSLA